MTYEPLPIIPVDLSRLELDLDNYRIPTRRANEAEALAYLFASEDVLGAARLIIRNGYFDNEVPVVFPSGENYVVQEGNRRVSALKALQDPDLVPQHADEVRALLRRYAIEAENLPLTIRVLVAESREQAAPHVARMHTGRSKKRWSLDQQATFYFSLLGPGTTVEDVKAAYPDVAVARFMRMAVMRRFLDGVKFVDPSLHDYAVGPKLAMSAFEYAYRNADIAAAMGAVFDRDGCLVPQTEAPKKIGSRLSNAQVAAVEYLMTQFRRGDLDTRSLQFRKGTTQKDALLALLTGAVQPHAEQDTTGRADDAGGEDDSDPGEGGGEDSGSDAGSSTGNGGGGGGRGGQGGRVEDASGDRANPRGPNHPDTKDRLVFGGLDYETHTSTNLQVRYIELRGLSLSTFPAATAMMLRSVLETTIKYHFEGSPTPVSGELKEVFKQVVSSYGHVRGASQGSINKIFSGPITASGTIAWFNGVAHNADAVVKAQDVRDAFRLLHPVLRLLLRPHGGQPTP